MLTNIQKNSHLAALSDHLINISQGIQLSLPHEYPPQLASQLCSADTQDLLENP